VEDTIVAMEVAQAASQGASPALVHIPQGFWDALRAVTCSAPSKVPESLTHSASFTMAREGSKSGGSSPMDISPPSLGWFTTPDSPILPGGEHPLDPIVLSSDKSSVAQMLESTVPHGEGVVNMGGAHVTHAPPTPHSDNSSPTPTPSGESYSMGTSG
jgi:hypothetical protein